MSSRDSKHAAILRRYAQNQNKKRRYDHGPSCNKSQILKIRSLNTFYELAQSKHLLVREQAHMDLHLLMEVMDLLWPHVFSPHWMFSTRAWRDDFLSGQWILLSLVEVRPPLAWLSSAHFLKSTRAFQCRTGVAPQKGQELFYGQRNRCPLPCLRAVIWPRGRRRQILSIYISNTMRFPVLWALKCDCYNALVFE